MPYLPPPWPATTRKVLAPQPPCCSSSPSPFSSFGVYEVRGHVLRRLFFGESFGEWPP
ncbi:hypothetical protein GBA52_024404 [Prunus armeniaca]|nr:hypothetical protein GBA52_024404 [Prunus armeniaca]